MREVEPPSWSWATMPTPMISACTMFCTAVACVNVWTSWVSWARKSAPSAVPTTLPRPPVRAVPPSTTAAIEGSR